jgi:hypothetical protein
MVGACKADTEENFDGVVIGSVFLLRSHGHGAVRIPLVYGRNIWDWWSPPAENVASVPPDAVAWRGENELSSKAGKGTMLFRIRWEATTDEAPVTAVAFASQMQTIAPFVTAINALP